MPHGIPHSEFLGWDPDDQDLALAYVRDKNARCRSCGTKKEEWEDDPFVYVGWQETCPGCEVLELEQQNVHERAKGVKVKLIPRKIAEILMIERDKP